MKPLKIAILSLTHGHTRKYYQTLRDNPKLEWVAVYAENEFVKDVFENSGYSVPCYLDINEMLVKHPDIEAVVLASANNRHLEQTRFCAERGLHILSMKIPTFDMHEYDEMISCVDKAGIICQVELELHYNPVVMRMKQLINDGLIGKIHSFQATNITLTPIWAFPWQGDPIQSYGKKVPLCSEDSRYRGGALCDHPHIFDLIRWITNSDFENIYSDVGPNIRTELQVEDNLIVTGKMKDKVSFLLDPSWSRTEERLKVPGPGWEIAPKRMEVNIAIHGEKGTLMADCFGPNIYHNGAPNDRYTVQYTYFDEWIGLIDEFVECVRENKQPKINLKWHRRTIEAMNACYDSIDQKKPIVF